jgi:hypothetical protein
MRRGFTLVEAITTITLISLLGSSGAVLISTGARAYSAAAGQAQLHQELSTAMEMVVRAIREIPADSAATSLAPSITSVTATSIAWGTSSLSLTGTNLEYVESGGTARVLLSDVTSFSVQCYNESNVAMAATLSGVATKPVQRVQVQVTVARNGISETLRTRVFMRSLLYGGAP